MSAIDSEVFVYGYSTNETAMANTTVLINDNKPLETDVIYNVSASKGVILVAYTKSSGSFTMNFEHAQTLEDLFGQIDYQQNPILALCVILLILTVLTIMYLCFLKCLKKHNKDRAEVVKPMDFLREKVPCV